MRLRGLLATQSTLQSNRRGHPPQRMTRPEATTELPQPVLHVIPRDEHGISRKQMSQSALRVLYRLREAGFGAYLVGGAVRDLLVGGQPKDFDVATDATPEQVKAL